MKIGFIGLGIMGESMCENIVKKHDDKVYVYDLIPEQIKKLTDIGAIACKSALEVAENADVIFSIVPTSNHSKQVYNELLPALKEGKYCVDMGTIDPSASVEISKTVKETGAQFLDAPVLKSKPAAIAGELGIVVGGDKEAFEFIKPLLAYMGNTILYMGANGNGLVMKICSNSLLGEVQNGVNETLVLAEKYGISLDNYVAAVALGSGHNVYLTSKVEAIRNKDYTTAFSTENMAKDLGICKTLSDEAGLPMPGVEKALDVYKWLLDNDYAKKDYSCSIEAIRAAAKK
jgi:3-hydroxyisobutyrate dehydrogenase and related beta-hydroxyacid dehydrogenases